MITACRRFAARKLATSSSWPVNGSPPSSHGCGACTPRAAREVAAPVPPAPPRRRARPSVRAGGSPCCATIPRTRDQSDAPLECRARRNGRRPAAPDPVGELALDPMTLVGEIPARLRVRSVVVGRREHPLVVGARRAPGSRPALAGAAAGAAESTPGGQRQRAGDHRRHDHRSTASATAHGSGASFRAAPLPARPAAETGEPQQRNINDDHRYAPADRGRAERQPQAQADQERGSRQARRRPRRARERFPRLGRTRAALERQAEGRRCGRCAAQSDHEPGRSQVAEAREPERVQGTAFLKVIQVDRGGGMVTRLAGH